MKVLLDECVDWRLSRDIVGHEVKSARQMGWSAITNGELLTIAAELEVEADRIDAELRQQPHPKMQLPPQ